MKQHGPYLKLYGIDLEEDHIRRIPPGIYDQLLSDSATSLPFADASFDTIVAGELVEHIPAHELPVMLREFHRLLRPGGRLLLTTPNPHSYLVNLRQHDIFADPSHINIMAVSVLSGHLSETGFASTRVTGSGKVSRHPGERFPLFNGYGSYLTVSQKGGMQFSTNTDSKYNRSMIYSNECLRIREWNDKHSPKTNVPQSYD